MLIGGFNLRTIALIQSACNIVLCWKITHALGSMQKPSDPSNLVLGTLLWQKHKQVQKHRGP